MYLGLLGKFQFMSLHQCQPCISTLDCHFCFVIICLFWQFDLRLIIYLFCPRPMMEICLIILVYDCHQAEERPGFPINFTESQEFCLCDVLVKCTESLALAGLFTNECKHTKPKQLPEICKLYFNHLLLLVFRIAWLLRSSMGELVMNTKTHTKIR